MRYRSRIRFTLEGLEGIVILTGAMCTWPLSKRWLENWGADLHERERTWPGDHLVATKHHKYVRAIDIAAPADTVWPWIVQFGLGRAGFYSYELLERLVGIPVKNVESVESTMQSLAVGDEIQLHPKAPGIPVALLERGRHVCFGTVDEPDSDASKPEPNRSWSIYVEQAPGDSCRLLLRGCIDPAGASSWSKRLAAALEESVDFTMEQRMLRTIKRLAEESAEPR